jgi:hypothetical protein
VPTPTISRTAMLVGLCGLIPFPFIDELGRRYLLSLGYQEQAKLAGRPLPDGAGWKLARRRSNILIGCLLAVFWWPIKKLFRTFFYFLTIKDAIDWMAEAAVRGAMVDRALERGHLPDDLDQVWGAIDHSVSKHVSSPVKHLLLGRKAPPLAEGPAPGGFEGLVAYVARYAGGRDALVAYESALDGTGADRLAPTQIASSEE